MTIRSFWFAGGLAVLALACSSSSASPSGDEPPPDADDVEKCTEQPENVRIQYCDAEEDVALFACEEGSPPPSDSCTATEQDDAYCCPVAKTKPTDTDPGTENPYGEAYPSGKTGFGKGQVIPNLSMDGYAEASTKQTKISLANFYDPEGRTHDVLAIVVGGVWDQLTKLTLDMAADSKADRFKTLSVLGQGAEQGKAAKLSDLGPWQKTYSFAAHGLDANFALFKPAFDVDAIPLIIIVDASTMKICHVGVGAETEQSLFDKSIENCRP